ncbi:MAG: SDR family oxidoreductase [Rhodospirillaceae bacterium]|nr:SDR family oxidoreductase [Rhodospirillaceae bacterium]
MFDDLKGLRVLVTGASTGIGAAVAKGFAAEGCRVAVHYNASADAAKAVVEAIGAAGGDAKSLAGDLSRRGEAERVVADAVTLLGGLDVLVNNAGALVRRAMLEEIDDILIDQVFDLNVRQLTHACRAALPHLRKNAGTIINTGSIAGRHGGGPGAGVYAAAKAWVQSFTRNLAKEFAADGIRVNAVAPGVIYTPFHERFSTPDQLETMRKTIPMGRLGTPEECVGAYLFLASKAAAGYITGQVIEVNGGQLMP